MRNDSHIKSLPMLMHRQTFGVVTQMLFESDRGLSE